MKGEATMSSDATPRPWSFDHDWHRLPTIFGADVKTIIAIIEKRGHKAPTPETAANAALIIEAVNNYDRLQSELTQARENLKRVKDGLASWPPPTEKIIEAMARAIAPDAWARRDEDLNRRGEWDNGIKTGWGDTTFEEWANRSTSQSTEQAHAAYAALSLLNTPAKDTGNAG